MEKVILLISDVFNIYHAVFALYTHKKNVPTLQLQSIMKCN